MKLQWTPCTGTYYSRITNQFRYEILEWNQKYRNEDMDVIINALTSFLDIEMLLEFPYKEDKNSYIS